jgi:hypothetical protein
VLRVDRDERLDDVILGQAVEDDRRPAKSSPAKRSMSA